MPPEQARALAVGQEALNDVRQSLPYGRSNIVIDNVVTGLSGGLRHQAGRLGLDRFPPASMTWPDPDAGRQDQRRLGELGARALFMGSGVCAEQGALACARLAPSLHPNDRIALAFSQRHDHGWVDFHATGGTDRSIAHVVVDPWGEAPALLVEDCALYDLPDLVRDEHRALDALTATAALMARWNELHRHTTPEAEVMLLLLSGTPWDVPSFAPTPIIRASALKESQVLALDSLHQRRERATALSDPARAARLARPQTLDRLTAEGGPLADGQDPLLGLRAAVVAHAVARQAGATVRGAAALAPGIVQAGLALGEPQQRPQAVASPAQQAAARQWLDTQTRGAGRRAL